MAIQCSCPECDYTYKIVDELAGKKVLCPECKTRFKVKGTQPVRRRRDEERCGDEDDRSRQGPCFVPYQTGATANSLGIASLVLGVLAFIVSLIPLAGLAGVVAGGLGLLLGVSGLCVALVRNGTSIGFSIAGSCLSVLAINIAMFWASLFGAVSKPVSETRKDEYPQVSLLPAVRVKSDMPVKTYKATRPKGPHTFVLSCELSDHYNYHYHGAQATHLSVLMVEPDTWESLRGYVRKDSPEGKKLLEILKDGRKHQLIVNVELDGKASDIVAIIRLRDEKEADEELAMSSTARSAHEAPPVANSDVRGHWDKVGNSERVGAVVIECLQARPASFSCNHWEGWRIHGPMLVVELKLTNTSATKIVKFHGWQEASSIVEDEHSNRYGLIDFGVDFEGFGSGLWSRWNLDPSVNSASIVARNLSLHPGKSYVTYLFCMNPADIAKEARLTLPAKALEGTGTVRMWVPISGNIGKPTDVPASKPAETPTDKARRQEIAETERLKKEQERMVERDHEEILAYMRQNLPVIKNLKNRLWSDPVHGALAADPSKEGNVYRLQGRITRVGSDFKIVTETLNYYFLVKDVSILAWEKADGNYGTLKNLKIRE
jgi:hypothetical protein